MSVEEGADVAKEAMLNVRLTPEMQDRIMAVIQTTGGKAQYAVTRPVPQNKTPRSRTRTDGAQPV